MSEIDWSAKFNALPLEVRIIGSAMEARTRIQHLNFEKRRLEKRHSQSLKEINEHIRNCEKFLADLTLDRSTQAKPEQAETCECGDSLQKHESMWCSGCDCQQYRPATNFNLFNNTTIHIEGTIHPSE